MLENQDLIKLYTNMVRIRKTDEYMGDLSLEGRLPMYHSPLGQEAIGVGAATFLRKDDYLFVTHRGHGIQYALAKGVPIKDVAAEHLFKETGGCKGMAFYHVTDLERGFLGFFGLLGGKQTIANGVALAAKKKGKGQVVLCTFGDGEWARGQVHEAMNMSALFKLPIVWICENNAYAVFMPAKDASNNQNLADLASAYSIPGEVVDGNDVIAVYEATQRAVDRARNGEGPSMLEFKTYRRGPHSVGMPYLSHADPPSQEETKAWEDRDPIKLFLDKLLSQGVLNQGDIMRIDHEVEAEIADAAEYAEGSPTFDLSAVDLDEILYAN